MKTKRLFIILLCLLICSLAYCLDNQDTIKHSGVLTLHSDNNYPIIYRDIFTWIIALLIGTLPLIFTNRQINQSKKSLEDQIRTTKEIALLDYNKSVKSTNRQEWINTLRDCVSEYLAEIETYKVNLENAKTLNKVEDFLHGNTSSIKIRKLGIKIELMLNPSEEKSAMFLNTFYELSSSYFNEKITLKEQTDIDQIRTLKEKLVDVTKSILKEEWERVKKGE